jgi:hypothetical protein
MDPIGFALENFDGIGLWRTKDEGTDVDPKAQLFDNSNVTSPGELREWLATKYGRQFTTVATEKLLTYALGRGVEYRDMPLVRAITRDALASEGRFSAIVLGVVKSAPFQMNTRTEPAAASTASARANTETRGAN